MFTLPQFDSFSPVLGRPGRWPRKTEQHIEHKNWTFSWEANSTNIPPICANSTNCIVQRISNFPKFRLSTRHDKAHHSELAARFLHCPSQSNIEIQVAFRSQNCLQFRSEASDLIEQTVAIVSQQVADSDPLKQPFTFKPFNHLPSRFGSRQAGRCHDIIQMYPNFSYIRIQCGEEYPLTLVESTWRLVNARSPFLMERKSRQRPLLRHSCQSLQLDLLVFKV